MATTATAPAPTTSATGSRRLEYLRGQHDHLVQELTRISDTAADQHRDLTEAEQTTVDERRQALERCDAELRVEAELVRSQNEYLRLMADVGPLGHDEPAGPAPSSPPPPGGGGEVYRSAGEYLRDFYSRAEDPAAAERFERYREHLRAAPHVTTADVPGVVPTPVLGPVWNTINSRRPAVEAATARPMPGAGQSFTRPVVTQHTDVATQATQKTALASRPLTIDPRTVTKVTKGGYVNLSFQARDWSDPAIMDVLVSDLAAQYAQETDEQFCTDFVAGVTATTTLATNDAAGWLTALYTAAGAVYASDNRLPDTLWCAIDVWATLGSLVDAAGRPMFPSIAPQNALGQAGPTTFAGQVAGMRLAVDAHFAPGTAIVGDSLAVEFYEQVGGQVQATEPSVLGVNIAFYGYMADLVVVPGAFSKIAAETP